VARNQRRPITEEELAEFEDALEEHQEQTRAVLAEELGGEPEDYDPTDEYDFENDDSED